MVRTFERQVTGLHIRVALLNRVTQLGRPVTVPVAQLCLGSGETHPVADLCNKTLPTHKRSYDRTEVPNICVNSYSLVPWRVPGTAHYCCDVCVGDGRG